MVAYTSDINWTDHLIIRAFCASDHAGGDISADKRSTSGLVVSIQGFIISTASKTQATMASSSGEADTLALPTDLHECCAIKNILSELGFDQILVTHIMSDDDTANRYSSQFGSGKRRDTLTFGSCRSRTSWHLGS